MSNIVYAFFGGLLLGIATVGYLYINGRIAESVVCLLKSSILLKTPLRVRHSGLLRDS